MSRITEIIRESEVKTFSALRRDFQAVGKSEGTGFSFPCNPDGTIIPDENYDCWKENYEYCIAHPEEYIDNGVERTVWNYVEPALAQCSCGFKIQLTGDKQCECGQWYNRFGQALKDPEFWEDEY